MGKYTTGIQIQLLMPTDIKGTVDKINEQLKNKIKANILFEWTKSGENGVDTTLSKIRTHLKNNPLKIRIDTYINQPAINAQIIGLQNQIQKTVAQAQNQVNSAVKNISQSTSSGGQGYTPSSNGLVKYTTITDDSGERFIKELKTVQNEMIKTHQIFTGSKKGTKNVITENYEAAKKLNAQLEAFKIIGLTGIDSTVKKAGKFVDPTELANLNKIKIELKDLKINDNIINDMIRLRSEISTTSNKLTQLARTTETFNIQQKTLQNKFSKLDIKNPYLTSELTNEINKLKQQYTSITSATPDNIRALRQLNGEFDVLTTKISKTDQEYKKLSTQQRSQLNKLTTEMNKVNSLQDKTKVLPKGEQDVDKLVNKIKNLKDWISKLQQQVNSGTLVSDKQLRGISEAQNKLGLLEQNLKKIHSNKTQLEVFKKGSLSEIDSVIAKAGKFADPTMLANLNKLKVDLNNLKINDNILNQMAKLKSEITIATKEMSNLSQAKKTFESTQNTIQGKLLNFEYGKTFSSMNKNLSKEYGELVKQFQNIKYVTPVSINQLKQLEQALSNIKLRVKEISDAESRQQSVEKQLNTKYQSALGLGVKFNNLSPENVKLLENQLNRYKNIIQSFQDKNKIGINVDDKSIAKLQNVENRIKRFYDTLRIAEKDSQGFQFTKYENITSQISSKIGNVTNKQELWNKSLLENYKLLDRNIQETDKYIKVIQRLRQGSEIKTIGAYIDKSTGQVYKFSDSMKDLMVRTYDLGSAFKTALVKIGLWAGATSVFYGIARAAKAAWTEIVEVNTKLTELTKVMSNNTDYKQLMSDLTQTANYYSQTLNAALDSAIEFAKQGYEAEEAIKLADASLLGANVTMLSAGEIASYLTGILAQFNLTAEESTRVIDRLNEVDNNFAVTSTSLAQSLNKSGEAAQQYGVSIDQLIGYTTAIGTATRESGNIIGNMLKTSFSRIVMDDVQKQIESLGIATKNIAGDIRPISEIYSELANKWNLLSRQEKMQSATLIAGRWHVTRFLALMDNWKIATDAETTSQHSLNSAIEENYKHQRSLASQINKMVASFQELVVALGDSGVAGAMSGVLSVITQYIKGVTELTKYHGSTTASIAILTTSFLLLKPIFMANYRDIVAQNIALGIQPGLISRTAISWSALRATLITVTASVKALTVAMLTNPWTLILLGVTIIPMITGSIKKTREEQEQLNKTYQESIKKLEELKRISDTIGAPTLQNINDLETQNKEIQRMINLMGILKVKQSSGTLSFLGEKQFDSDDINIETKDTLANLGVDINKLKYASDIIKELKQRKLEIIEITEKATQNSTEYQAQIIKEAQSRLENEKSVVSLIDEYENLRINTNKNVEESLRYNEIIKILQQNFPQLYNEIASGSIKVTDLMRKEQQGRIDLASAHSHESREQLIASRASLQDQYNKTLKAISLYYKEIEAIDVLILKKKEEAGLKQIIDGEKTPMPGTGLMVTDIVRGSAKNIDRNKKDIKTLRSEANNLANELAEIDQIMNSGSKFGSSKEKDTSSPKSSSSSTSKEKFTNEKAKIEEIKTLLSQINSIKETYSKTSEEYRTNIDDEILKYQQLQDALHNYADAIRASDLSPEEKKLEVAKQSTEWFDTQKKIASLRDEKTNSFLDEQKNKIEAVDKQYSLLETKLSQYNETSQEYRDGISSEITLLRDKQNYLHEQAEILRTAIASGELSAEQIENYNNQIKDFQSTWETLQNSINDNSFKIINSNLAVFDENIENIKNNIDQLTNKLNVYTENSLEYLNIQKQINQLTQEYIQQLISKSNYLTQELSTLNPLSTKYHELLTLQQQINNEIQSQYIIAQTRVAQIADNIISQYKEMYGQQKELALEAKDKELDAEEEKHDSIIDGLDNELKVYEETKDRQNDILEEQISLQDKQHDKLMSALDDESSKYEELINFKLKLLETEEETADYNSQLSDLQNEKNEIINKITLLSKNNSYTSRAEIYELQKELVSKEKEINKLATSRNIDLKKEEYQNQLDIYKDTIEAKKKLENEKYNKEKERIEAIKKQYENEYNVYKEYIEAKKVNENELFETTKKRIEDEKIVITKHYDELINDERRFAQIRQEIIEGNLSTVQSDFAGFKDFVNTNLEDIGTSISNNLVDGMNNAIIAIQNAKAAVNDLASAMSRVGSVSVGSVSGGSLISNNDNDYEVSTVVDFSDWGALVENEIKEEHDGGIVSSESSTPSKLTQIVNKLFNTQPNEQIVKMLKGELAIPQNNIVSNFIPNMKNLINSLTTQPVVATSNDNTYHLNVYVDNLHTGNKKETNQLCETLVTGIKKMGG